MSQNSGQNSGGRFRPSPPSPPVPPASKSIKTRLVSARSVLLGAVLAGVLTAITGWTTGGINWVWNSLTGDSSPVDVAKLPPAPEVTGYGQGSATPLPEGGLAIANAYFSASESLGAGHCTLYAVVPRPVSQVQPPRLVSGNPDITRWSSDNNIGDPDVTTYSFLVSAKPGKTVTL